MILNGTKNPSTQNYYKADMEGLYIVIKEPFPIKRQLFCLVCLGGYEDAEPDEQENDKIAELGG